jgi:hypothetical protein
VKQPKARTFADDLENQGRAALQKMLAEQKAGTVRLGAGLDPEYLGAYAKIGAAKVIRGTVDFAEWSAQMLKEFGENIKPHLRAIWTESNRMIKETKAPPIALAETKPAVKVSEMKDISGFKAYHRDIYRNFRDAFGKNYEVAKKAILDPFDDSKKANTVFQDKILTDLKKNVVDKYGIKKGSKESALIQQYGEGQITLDELKKMRPKDWQKIVEADKWFRGQYDQLLGQVNAARKEIYPNAEQKVKRLEEKIAGIKLNRKLSAAERNSELKSLEAKLEDAMRGKIIPRRQDYYRHFQEMAEGFQGLANIFDAPSGISPGLAGISRYTKPKSKWLSFAQERLGGKFKNDAVGGFLEYLPSASYAIHIDPHIAKFRALAADLREATVQTKTNHLGNFINSLELFADNLAGKTNPAYGDRFAQEVVPGGRTTFKAIDWLNNRIKANTILGNASSTLAQLGNVPNGIAFAKQYAVSGMGRTLRSILIPDAARAKSGFMVERYGRGMYRQFDQKFLQQPVKFAEWAMETADRVGTEFIWQSAYSKGLAQKVADPVRFADNATRSLVAGRGIGEVPIGQKSKVFQLIAPFQLEVGNAWWVMEDMVKSKDVGGLITLAMASWMFNRAMEQVRGSGVTFDPIQAMIEASQEDTAPKAVGRLAGEVLSNVPLGQTAASAYPEYGMNVMGYQMPTRKEFFGREDPTRFGTGPLLVKTLLSPSELPWRLIPPAGGVQMEKTYKGAKALEEGGVFTQKGQLKYPIAPDAANTAKGLLFGNTGFKEALPYYSKGLTPLTEKQTEKVMKSSKPPLVYKKTQLEREKEKIDKQIDEITKNKTLSATEKARRKATLRQKKRELKP